MHAWCPFDSKHQLNSREVTFSISLRQIMCLEKVNTSKPYVVYRSHCSRRKIKKYHQSTSHLQVQECQAYFHKIANKIMDEPACMIIFICRACFFLIIIVIVQGPLYRVHLFIQDYQQIIMPVCWAMFWRNMFFHFLQEIPAFIHASCFESEAYHLKVFQHYNTLFYFLAPASNIVTSSDQTITAPAELTLNCSADGKPTPTITWTKVFDNTVVTMPLNITRGKTKESYRCTADNGVGNPLTKDVIVNILCE